MRCVALLLAVLAVLAGCGIKGEPVSPGQEPPPIPPAGESGGLEL